MTAPPPGLAGAAAGPNQNRPNQDRPNQGGPNQSSAGVGRRAAPRVLVAGIGNVFLGDDGFGVHVVRQITRGSGGPDSSGGLGGLGGPVSLAPSGRARSRQERAPYGRATPAASGRARFRPDRVPYGPIPDGVDVADYGIRGIHLAYDLLDGPYATVVMVDAAPVNGPPGTVALLEVDTADTGRRGAPAGASPTAPADSAPADGPPTTDFLTKTGAAAADTGVTGTGVTGTGAVVPGFDAHGLHPEAVLALLRDLGGHIDRVLVVGCRPATFDEGMTLSEPVAASVDAAARLVIQVAGDEAAALASAGERRNAR